jgi:EmrB/QacA subfamily drug resistance transporter
MLVYLAALVALFMATMDMQIVVTALPTIASEFGDLHLFGWVGSSYLLATAAVSPFYGKLGDMFGRKNVVMTAIVLFLIGSLACGLAWSMESLVAARVLQGLGGGGLMVSTFAIIGELFEPRERSRYQGYSAAVFALSSLVGPFVGGTITEFFGWRWTFLINLPIGIAVLGLIWFAMQCRPGAARRKKVDYTGGILLALATTAIVYWADHVLSPTGPDLLTYALPLIGLVAALGFVAVERRAEEPIIPLRLFANPTISLVTGMSTVMGVCTLGLFFYYALYIQTITGLSPAQVGLLFMPASIGSMIASILIGRAVTATGRYKWYPVIGMALGAVLMLGFTTINAGTPFWVIGAMMFGFGIGMGLQFQVLMVAVQANAPLSDIGAATGLVTQTRTIGSSLGLAVNGAVMAWALAGQQSSLSPEAAAALPDGLEGLTPHAAAALAPAVRDTVMAHYTSGFNTMFLFVAAMYVLGTVLALMLPDREIERQAPAR